MPVDRPHLQTRKVGAEAEVFAEASEREVVVWPTADVEHVRLIEHVLIAVG